MFWFSDKLSPLDICFIFFLTQLFISKRHIVSVVLSFGLQAWDSNIAVYQQFQIRIYYNFEWNIGQFLSQYQ